VSGSASSEANFIICPPCADTGAQQLIAPLVLTGGLAGARDGNIGLLRRAGLVEESTVGNARFNGERPVMRSLSLERCGWSYRTSCSA